MEIKFRDVGRGIVAARASIELESGVQINEVTILKRGPNLEIEFPQKSFKGQDGRIHFVDIITFDTEEKRIVWELEIKEQYQEWRKQNRPVSVYENPDYEF
ncbi:MAG: hypothetical protein WCX83_05465 [Candidatus Cloacimonas sp.]|nr:hypothetical protein [Candidatus Cloacimonadota bacterium]